MLAILLPLPLALPLALLLAPPRDVPVIDALKPANAVVGTGAMTLIVRGSGFTRTSEVRWNGTARTTTYVAGEELRADLLAGDLATLGTAQVTVYTQGGAGGTSNAVAFTVGNPAPTVASLSPTSAPAGGEPFSLVVTGKGFAPNASVRWNGSPRPTTYESPTRLVASIPAADLATTGAAQVTVLNPAPLGGTSEAATLSVALARPAIAAVAPAQAAFATTARVDTFTLRVTGTNFVRGAVVRWGGADRVTRFVSPTQLEALILDADVNAVTSPTTVPVTVRASVAGAGTTESASIQFPLVYPKPSAWTIQAGAVGGDRIYWEELPTGLRVKGANFVQRTSVTVNGHRDTSTFLDETTVGTYLQRSWFEKGGTYYVQVETPGPGGGSVTMGSGFTLFNPRAYPSALSPSTGVTNGAAFTLAVRGTKFMQGATVRWDGRDLPTTFVADTLVRAQVASTDLTFGSHAVTVRNPYPAPDGASLSFSVYAAPTVKATIAP